MPFLVSGFFGFDIGFNHIGLFPTEENAKAFEDEVAFLQKEHLR